MRSPLVYFLVLNYCSLDDTLACVDAIRRIDYDNLRLLVIDNNSPDGSGMKLRQAINNDEEFLQLPRNSGYAGGNNEGFRRALLAGADYVMIVNPDIRLSRESIEEYINLLESDQSIGALNPIQLMESGFSIDEKFRFGIWGSRGYEPPTVPIDPSGNWDVHTLYGAALLLPSRTLKKIGGFDPLYFAYGEEEDLCRRIRRAGLRLVVTGRSPVRHLRTNEASGVDDFRLFLRLKGNYLYELKNPDRGFGQSLRLACVNILRGILGKTGDRYPFNRYPIRRWHIIRAALWLLWHIRSIRAHLILDRKGIPYT